MNSIFPILVGIIIKKMKIRVALIILAGPLALGGFFQAFSGVFAGGWNTALCYILFLFGRFVFYSGSDSFSIIRSKLIFII